MDLEDQGAIKQVAEQYNGQNLMVVLGAPSADAAGIAAETVTIGDPTYAGVLAGVSLGLPTYHILEPEIKEQVDPAVYAEQVGVMEAILESEKITAEMRRVRALSPAAA